MTVRAMTHHGAGELYVGVIDWLKETLIGHTGQGHPGDA